MSAVIGGAFSDTENNGNSSELRWAGTKPRRANSEMTAPKERFSACAMARAAASTASSMSNVVRTMMTIHHRINASTATVS